MSVIVQNLTKIYGEQRAVDKVSFTANQGQILGFLGPNGAGKSTTMKMITSYLFPDEGTALVCDIDVKEHPIEVRRKVGYLPEHNSLYQDMYVREYLSFMAGIHKVKNRSAAVDDMIDKTGLNREAHKKIHMLSKGYRQRVGLAQAMIHDPEVLILDEPTSGLDPNQLVEIRHLIKTLGQKKTVIFSTHIMQEVQALCDRVVIINKGNLVADRSIDDLDTLIQGERKLILQLKRPMSRQDFTAINGVVKVNDLGNGKWCIFHDQTSDIREEVFNIVVADNNVILGMNQEISTIEDVFQTVTK